MNKWLLLACQQMQRSQNFRREIQIIWHKKVQLVFLDIFRYFICSEIGIHGYKMIELPLMNAQLWINNFFVACKRKYRGSKRTLLEKIIWLNDVLKKFRKKERISEAKGVSLDKIFKDVADYLRNLILYVVNFESTKRFSRSYSFGSLAEKLWKRISVIPMCHLWYEWLSYWELWKTINLSLNLFINLGNMLKFKVTGQRISAKKPGLKNNFVVTIFKLRILRKKKSWLLIYEYKSHPSDVI